MANLSALHNEIVAKLQNEFGFKEHDRYLQQGLCPECSRKDLYTSAEKPFYIRCNHLESCQYETTIKELFPELFENFNERFVPSDTDPNATATAYLEIRRGFPVEKITGWYEQNFFKRGNSKSTATVRFFLSEDRTLWWERFVETIEIKTDSGRIETRPCNFSSSERSGIWWQPPKQEINPGDTVYLCEGILKAIPLCLSGKKAVSIMASGSFPYKSLEPHRGKNINWVWALDSDSAGRKATFSHHRALLALGENSTAIFSTEFPKKLDWDDLPVNWGDVERILELVKTQKTPEETKELADLIKRFPFSEANLKKYRYYGELELADSYHKKAFLMWSHRANTSKNSLHPPGFFCFDFAKNTYAVAIEKSKFDKKLNELLGGGKEDGFENSNLIDTDNEDHFNTFINTAEVRWIATCSYQFLYYLRSDDGDNNYVFKIRMSNGTPDIIGTFPLLSKADSFKDRGQKIQAGINFMGSNSDINWLYNCWMSHKPPTVEIISYIGYSPEYDAYIFNKMAVQGKKIIGLNSDDFFQLKKVGVKTAINKQFEISKTINFDWVKDYKTAYSDKGMVVLCWWISCLLIQQIKAKHKDFPYLSVIGEAASGKTAMLLFLWKLLGLDGKTMTLNPNVDTKIGFYKGMARLANIPVHLNEVDNEESIENARQKRQGFFDWNQLKPLYDGEGLRTTAQKQGNNLNQDQFKTNLIVSQNIAIREPSEAIITRFCNITFDRSHHQADGSGKRASDRLLNLETKYCSGFLLHIITKSQEILAEFDKQLPRAMSRINQFSDEIFHQRIKDTHGKLLAVAYCLELILPAITKDDIADIEATIIEMAVERQSIISKDHRVVTEFWAMFDELDTKVDKNSDDEVIRTNQNNLNHIPKSRRENEIAIHLPSFLKAVQDKYGIANVPSVDDLHRLLPTSKTRPFQGQAKFEDGYKTIQSSIEGKSMKCYLFYKLKK